MDVRQKLVELIGRVQQMGVIYRESQMDERYPTIEQIRNTEVASYLIAHGVTVQEDCKECAEATQSCIVKLQEQIAELRSVQEWVSVDDRLPEEKVNCIVHYKHAYCNNDGYWAIGFCFYDGEKFQFDPAYKVTHWMPIPQQPKGE